MLTDRHVQAAQGRSWRPRWRRRMDVLHPDHAPPPGKTDTHFTAVCAVSTLRRARAVVEGA
eukprot:6710663-Prymnesium_polylepis.1